MDSKVERNNIKKTLKLKSIRITSETERKLEKLLTAANKKKLGRKIKADQILNIALDNFNESHIQMLQNSSLTNEDRKELLRQKYIELRGPISKDEFTGFILSNEAFSFYEEVKLS